MDASPRLPVIFKQVCLLLVHPHYHGYNLVAVGFSSLSALEQQILTAMQSTVHPKVLSEYECGVLFESRCWFNQILCTGPQHNMILVGCSTHSTHLLLAFAGTAPTGILQSVHLQALSVMHDVMAHAQKEKLPLAKLVMLWIPRDRGRCCDCLLTLRCT